MKLTLSEASGVPYYRQVRDAIADMVRAGRLLPGSPMPSIRELAADTLVSVITIKKAYEELEAMGLVVSHQGRGTFVAAHGIEASRQKLVEEITTGIAALVRKAAESGVAEAEVDAAIAAAKREAYGVTPGRSA